MSDIQNGQVRAVAGTVSLYAAVGLSYLGAFSRFTHGRYTPAFYSYQVERAPDDESTRLVPLADFTLATLLLFPKTRKFSALFCATFAAIGVLMRLKARKNALKDSALALVAATAAWTSVMGY